MLFQTDNLWTFYVDSAYWFDKKYYQIVSCIYYKKTVGNFIEKMLLRAIFGNYHYCYFVNLTVINFQVVVLKSASVQIRRSWVQIPPAILFNKKRIVDIDYISLFTSVNISTNIRISTFIFYFILIIAE